MALAASVIYTAIDDSGERGTTEIKVPTGFTLSQYGEFGSAMATLLDAFLAGKVETAQICFGVDISTLTSNAVLSTADVEEIGAFQFATSEGRPVSVNVPCLDELVVAAGSDDIDQGNANVAAFIAAMESGIAVTGGTISPCDIAEDDVVSTNYARERFRASGRRS